MDSSLIQSLFNFIREYIFAIIYLFALGEIILVVSIYRLMKNHERILLDVSDNLLKGFRDSPDRDSMMTVSERIRSALDFIEQKMASEPQVRQDFAKNANKISQRPLYNRHDKIEVYASIMATLVQVFPLLGILGTILAIAQTAFQNGGKVDVSSLSNAFVLAMDTTILGITFSIIFMVVESVLHPKIGRVIEESSDTKKIIAHINMS